MKTPQPIPRVSDSVSVQWGQGSALLISTSDISEADGARNFFGKKLVD